ncbi:hypothetical protein PoB_004198900 [Plakobranchus ocellatus]|uniref:Uncharacterized protein n=1 Tax=Plakobranchus ocellatus TaxID=259542 RepID=A0AAV4B5V5_9GAST|nr:hypothetical protein PoB_004198900 [Plakobranchus ocellatus]
MVINYSKGFFRCVPIGALMSHPTSSPSHVCFKSAQAALLTGLATENRKLLSFDFGKPTKSQQTMFLFFRENIDSVHFYHPYKRAEYPISLLPPGVSVVCETKGRSTRPSNLSRQVFRGQARRVITPEVTSLCIPCLCVHLHWGGLW